MALLLRIDLTRLPQANMVGIGNQLNTTYFHPVTIDLGQGLVFQVNAGFSSGLDRIGVGLLGQDGFFEQHTVEFRHAEKLFTVASIR